MAQNHDKKAKVDLDSVDKKDKVDLDSVTILFPRFNYLFVFIFSLRVNE